MFRSPAAPLAFSGTCSWLQTVAAGMLTWYVEFFFLQSSAGAPCLSTSPPAVCRISRVKTPVWGTAAAVYHCCEWSPVWFDFPNCSEQQQHGSEMIRLDSLNSLCQHVLHSFIVAGLLYFGVCDRLFALFTTWAAQMHFGSIQRERGRSTCVP